MSPWLQTVLTILGSILASSGFWAYILKRYESRDAERELLIGLAHDRILYLGNSYLERGDWITQSEYENLHDYLYVPYSKCGGNGSAEKVIQEVQAKLHTCITPPTK